MCWGLTATAAMTAAGVGAIAVSLKRHDAPAIPLTLTYFTIMEGLQFAGYLVIDTCGTPANEIITYLSMLHIVFQPLVVNAFVMHLTPNPLRPCVRAAVYGVSAFSAVIMLVQLYPFEWAGECRLGAVLCGTTLCTASGDWHLAWHVPYNGLLEPIRELIGRGGSFPTYTFAVFVMPVLYGAWRFAFFHAIAGPILASNLTTNVNEIPSIWCLFSIGILLISINVKVRQYFVFKPIFA